MYESSPNLALQNQSQNISNMGGSSVEADITSDYGSDFTPDEEAILHGLLRHAPVAVNPTLILKDIEDNEKSRGARLPRVYTRCWQPSSECSPATTRKQRSRIAVEMPDNSHIPANGE